MDWDDFWVGFFILLAVLGIVGGITYGAVASSNNHRSAVNNCLNHGRAPSECKGL